MRLTRRRFSKILGQFIGLGVLAGRATLAQEQTLAQTMQQLFADSPVEYSDQINIKIPHLAENSAAVPITAAINLAQVEKIWLLVAANPLPLSAHFTLTPAAVPRVSARLKMAKTSEVMVVVRAQQRLYFASQMVKVADNGCSR